MPRVGRVAARRFAGRSELSLDPDLRVYLGDLVRPYGVALREDLLERGAGHTYAEMAGELIRDTVREDEPVDLLILAYAMHDVRPGQSTALFLSDVCPGMPLAFTVCDQGSAGPFTAARIASEYLRGDDYQRALIIFAEQDALHYEPLLEPGVEVTLPEGNSAVAVLFEGRQTSGSDGTVLSSVRQFPDTAPDEVRGRLGAQVTEVLAAAPRPENSILILGGGLSKDDADGQGVGRVVTAAAGSRVPASGTNSPKATPNGPSRARSSSWPTTTANCARCASV